MKMENILKFQIMRLFKKTPSTYMLCLFSKTLFIERLLYILLVARGPQTFLEGNLGELVTQKIFQSFHNSISILIHYVTN